jgi:hypothetical protein
MPPVFGKEICYERLAAAPFESPHFVSAFDPIGTIWHAMLRHKGTIIYNVSPT